MPTGRFLTWPSIVVRESNLPHFSTTWDLCHPLLSSFCYLRVRKLQCHTPFTEYFLLVEASDSFSNVCRFVHRISLRSPHIKQQNTEEYPPPSGNGSETRHKHIYFSRKIYLLVRLKALMEGVTDKAEAGHLIELSASKHLGGILADHFQHKPVSAHKNWRYYRAVGHGKIPYST